MAECTKTLNKEQIAIKEEDDEELIHNDTTIDNKCSTATQRPEFNYMETKAEYMSLLNTIFNHKINHVEPWTEYSYKKISSQVMYSRSPEVLKYENVISNGVQSLVLSGTTIEVLTYEDCFNVFVDVHTQATDHGGYQEMKDILNDYYLYEKKCLINFLRSCTSCKHLNKPKKKKNIEINQDKFNQTVHIDFTNMVGISDTFKYIMTYVDRATNYVLIRPLVTYECEDIASELIKIFVDFGPPQEIHTINTFNISKALEIVNTSLKFEFHIVKVNKQSEITNEVVSKVQKWVIDNECSNWGFSCWLIQHSINTDDKSNPMKNVFGRSTPGLVLDKLIKKASGDEDLSSDEEQILKPEMIKHEANKSSTKRKGTCELCMTQMYVNGNICLQCGKTVHGCCGVRIKSENPEVCCFYCTKCQAARVSKK